MANRKAVYAASLDPITNGHINVIERIAPLYDEFVVLVAVDPRKTYRFTADERVSMAKSAVAHIANVTVDSCVGRYVVSHADSIGAQVIVRGLRNFKDLEDEQTLAEENRRICPHIETVWVPCLPELMHVSSSMVKGHVGADPGWKKQVARSVPNAVVAKLNEKFVAEKARKHWTSLMYTLGAPEEHEEVFKNLLAHYAEPHRRYHTIGHIVSMLDELEWVDTPINDLRALRMAIFYHDYVYDTVPTHGKMVAGNEERSATMAEQDIRKLGLPKDFSDRVWELIMATSHTGPAKSHVTDADYIVDLDLSILGAPPEQFDEYEVGIRLEYAHVLNKEFAKARAKILRVFLMSEWIYRTNAFIEAYENQARENLKRSITQLKKMTK